jgi:hypothetical protein
MNDMMLTPELMHTIEDHLANTAQATTLEGLLTELEAHLTEARQALTDGSVIPGQAALEDGLLVLLALLTRQNVNISAGLQRALSRQNHPQASQKVLRVYPDRAEWWVGAHYRGGWPLFSLEDRQRCEQLATQLGCQLDVTLDPTQQLQLFPHKA